jgi:hypothetical protein
MAAIKAEARNDEPAALREPLGLDRPAHAITGAAPCSERRKRHEARPGAGLVTHSIEGCLSC